jgi:hypothetical protein
MEEGFPPQRADESGRFQEALRHILDFARGGDAEAKEFVKLTALLDAVGIYIVAATHPDPVPFQLPDNDLEQRYLDLASGLNFAELIPYLNPGKNYLAVDHSEYVEQVLA